MLLFSFWQLIGCHIILSGTFSAYIVTHYPASIGRTSDGTCIDSSMCDPSTVIDMNEERDNMSSYETGVNVMWLCVQTLALGIMHNLAKKMVQM